MKRILLTATILLITISLFSQQTKPTEKQEREEQRVGKKLAALMKEADGALNDKKFKKAKSLYLKAIKIKPEFCSPKRALSGIYYYEDNYEDAISYLEEVIDECPYFSKIMYYELGLFYYRVGDYNKAIENFNQFKEYLPLPPDSFGVNGYMESNQEAKYKMAVDESIFQSRFANDSIPPLQISEVKNLGDAINSRSNDYFPFMTNDESVLLFTRGTRKNMEDFFVSYNENGTWTEGERVGDNFNTILNEGMCTCTRDNVRMYFTACQRDYMQGTCDIQQAILNVKDSVEVLSVEPTVGLNTQFWESQASISCDGRMMFFASNRPGGFGKTDIYVSYIKPDGTWGKAENVGPNINTNDYEESPFITNDGKTLFFSSTGRQGMGEQDVYMSRLQADGTWGKGVNLGSKVNTSARELGFFLTADGKKGYFASNRAGGKGLLDIYEFTLSEPMKSDPITFVEGFVKDSITLEPVQAVLEVSNGQKIGTDENGRFFRCLPPGPFSFKINEKEYLPYQETEMIPEWDNHVFYQMDILLQTTKPIPPKENPIVYTKPEKKPEPIIEPKPVTKPEPVPIVVRKPIFHTVYFDFDQYETNGIETKKLDVFVHSLYSNPYSRIELKAYCDYKGSNEYNINLSNQRAINIYNYLIRKGISKERISYIGLGEINDDNPRWMNRRVEIRVE